MTMTRTCACLALVGLMLVGAVARAENGLVVIRGKATERDRSTVGAAIKTVTHEAGWSLPAKPLSKKETDTLIVCSDSKTPWACIPPGLGAAGIHRVFLVGVDNEQLDTGAQMVVITGKVIDTSMKTFVVARRYCEHCADDKLTEAGAALANQLIRELDTQSGRTVVVIKSHPTGAQIILDGQRIGATDAKFSTYPGKHFVRLEKDYFVAENLEFTVEEGKTADVSVELRPSGAKPPQTLRPPSRPSLLPPILTVGAGAALVITGGALILADEDATPGGPQSERKFDSALFGVGCAVLGTAIVGGGVYWWVRRSKARTIPTASVSSNGFSFGWTGTF